MAGWSPREVQTDTETYGDAWTHLKKNLLETETRSFLGKIKIKKKTRNYSSAKKERFFSPKLRLGERNNLYLSSSTIDAQKNILSQRGERGEGRLKTRKKSPTRRNTILVIQKLLSKVDQ